MPLKPQVASQLMSQMGLGRTGGAASKGSTPVSKSKGANFSALENALLKKGVKKPADAKKVSGGGPGRQFFNQASGGDSSLGKPSSDKKISSQPGSSLKGAWSRNYSGGGF
jgi:hypothetical protein